MMTRMKMNTKMMKINMKMRMKLITKMNLYH